MSVWIVDPIDPLVFGDGRPFTAIPGGVLRSRPLPPPTALAGVVRAQLGKTDGVFDATRVTELLKVEVYGPLVALLRDDGSVEDWLFPRPRDAAFTEDGHVRWLRPVAWPDRAQGSDHETLYPLGCEGRLGKPPALIRDLWRFSEAMSCWLTHPETLPAAKALGVDGPQPDRRVHVAIDPKTGTAKDGALFSVEGRAWIIKHGEGFRRLGFAVAVADDKPQKQNLPKQSLHPLGGERRLAVWREHEPQPPKSPNNPKKADADWPAQPPELLAQLKTDKGLRVILATPAEFVGGSLPQQAAPFGLQGAKLVAVANDRAEVISGWDLQNNRPKPTRRLVPAGAVYFLDTSAVDRDALEPWLEKTWLKPVSDAPQAKLDGLGLALVGAWDGQLDTLLTP